MSISEVLIRVTEFARSIWDREQTTEFTRPYLPVLSSLHIFNDVAHLQQPKVSGTSAFDVSSNALAH